MAVVSWRYTNRFLATVLNLSQTKKFHCPLRQCCARLSKGMALILRGLMRCWSAVPECRSTLAQAGLAFKYPAILLVFMGWSICISSECHGRGSISQRTASPPIKLKVINLFSGIAGGFSYASARLSYPPRRVFFSVEMIFEIPEA